MSDFFLHCTSSVSPIYHRVSPIYHRVVPLTNVHVVFSYFIAICFVCTVNSRSPRISPIDFSFVHTRISSEIKLEFEFKPGDIQLVSNLTAFHGRDAHAPVEAPGKERWLMRTWMYLPRFRPLADEAVDRYVVVRLSFVCSWFGVRAAIWERWPRDGAGGVFQIAITLPPSPPTHTDARFGVIRHGNLGLTAREFVDALASAPKGFDPSTDTTLTFPQPRRSDGAPIRSVLGVVASASL
jgi:hypothetical protein